MKPKSLPSEVSLAKLYEEKYTPTSKNWSQKNFFTLDISPLVNHTKGTPLPIRATPVLPALGPPAPHQGISSAHVQHSQYKKISFNEMQLHKAKGFCFNCHEKFTPSHRCANRRLLLLHWDEDAPDDSQLDLNNFVVELDTTSQPEEQSLKHSLNAMNNIAVSGTLRFSGIVNGHSVKILLDGGNDDSFIQSWLAQFQNLEVQPTSSFKVLVAMVRLWK